MDIVEFINRLITHKITELLEFTNELINIIPMITLTQPTHFVTNVQCFHTTLHFLQCFTELQEDAQ